MQTNFSSKVDQPISYEIHYHPPEYPEKYFPSRCSHPPEFLMIANIKIVQDRKRSNKLEIDHSLCLGCGIPQPCTIGGNVLVDCQILLTDKATRHWRIYGRVQQIRDKWSKIATYLFDENGWNGRHEKIARQIDPYLTMKLILEPIEGTSKTRMGRIKFDPDYVRWVD